MTVKHLVESDGALTDSITNNLERVVKTVEKVKGASNEIVDGVTVVRELADENRMGAEDVVKDMQVSDVAEIMEGNSINAINRPCYEKQGRLCMILNMNFFL